LAKKPVTPYLYAIALGSNRAGSHRLTPDALITLAITRLDIPPCRLIATSTTLHSAPIGPSLRTYSNAAAIIECTLPPAALLAHLKTLEKQAGRRSGQRWGARTLDLDIILWSGGIHTSRTLHIPHKAYRTRSFVRTPLLQIAPQWRDPVTGHSIRQINAQENRPKPVDRRPAAL
jgi:2-amino-4-hydroxy-6-hydroxymethyldihydropteridine diphosphokinase